MSSLITVSCLQALRSKYFQVGQALHSTPNSHSGGTTLSARPPQPMAPSYHHPAVQPSRNVTQQQHHHPPPLASNVRTGRPNPDPNPHSYLFSGRKDLDRSSEPSVGPSAKLRHTYGVPLPSGKSSRYSTGPPSGPAVKKPPAAHSYIRDRCERRDSMSIDFDAIISNIAKKR